MNDLARQLSELIRAHGPIDVAKFMTLATSHPNLGYYSANAAIGADGDFITAPEVSQIFGELLGAWAASVWSDAGQPQPCQLIELGPGRGTMLSDLLRATKSLPDFHQALRLHLVESSPVLRDVQRAAIDHPMKHWHDHIEDVPEEGFRIVIGNEFLDTLPIKQLQKSDDRWYERLIGVDEDGNLAYVLGQHPIGLPQALGRTVSDVVDGMVLEFSPAREAFIDQLCHQLLSTGGAALFIDYGDVELSPGDSLQAVAKHTKVDPLASPGEADVTSRVTFAPLLATVQKSKVMAWGPVSQRQFLQRLGLDQRAQRLGERASVEQLASLRRGVDRLTGSDAMGDLFKVVALTTSPEIPAGFSDAERWQSCG